MAGKQSVRNSEEHKRLASVLKHIHADLRKKLRENHGDFDTVWSQHCQDQEVLSTYAQSMKTLAEEHWTKNSKTRIDWCRDTINEYFHGGGLKKVLEKEEKRQIRERRIKHGQFASVSKPDTGFEGQAEKMDENKDRVICSAESHISTHLQVLGEGSRVRLLDVGSCYNPFLTFDEFLTVGVDISPACQSVHRCDFMHVRITDGVSGSGEEDSEAVDKHLQSLTSPVEVLPACSFHVLVFCLLLEYLPARLQRWLCCVQAHRLLMTHGLLVIITPDSHSQHRNAPMIRSWRTAIEALGFSRWRYVKQQHLHCMAFRKLDHQQHPHLTLPDPFPPPARFPQNLQDQPPSSDGSLPSRPDDGAHPPRTNDSGDRLDCLKDSDEHPSSLSSLGDYFSPSCVDPAIVVKFADMMYIPQDLSDVSGEGDEGQENEEGFEGEEDRQNFFSAAESELPGFVSDDDD